MNRSNIKVFLSLLGLAGFLTICVEISRADVMTIEPWELYNCKKLALRIIKRQMKAFIKCSKDFKDAHPNIEEFNEKFQCVIKCSMDKIGLLEENKKVSNVTIQNFMEQHIPAELHTIGHIITEGCVEEHAPLMNDTDELCLAHGNFLKCLQDFVADSCP